MRPQLSSGHSKLCDYVIENFNHIPDYSGAKLAQSADVSISTLHRFIKLLDFDNFIAFRYAMRSEINRQPELGKNVTLTPVERAFNSVVQSAKLAHQSLSITQLNEVAKYISVSERIYLIQSGDENLTLDYFENKLRNISKSVIVIPEISLDVSQLDHKDLVVSIEQTGDEDTIVSLLTKGYSTDAMLVRFSNTISAKIQKLSDIDIHIPMIDTASTDVYCSEYCVGLMMVIDIIVDIILDVAQDSVT
jgi:Transcriptional regulators